MAKSTKPVSPKSESSDPIIEKVDNYAEYYVNHCQVGFTAFDIFMFLSEGAYGTDGKMHLRQKTRITMSPAEAKLLIEYVNNALTAYEASYNEVKIHPSQKVESAN
jgi:hypothetical protein